MAEAFFAWAKSQSAPPKLAITRALTYAIKQEPRLMNVFCDGRLELSNNRAERYCFYYHRNGEREWAETIRIPTVLVGFLAKYDYESA